jgi:hypothetical protein
LKSLDMQALRVLRVLRGEGLFSSGCGFGALSLCGENYRLHELRN